uniref:thiol oxidase n=1 Tax=viral metagenome TaxID=1070528 RepID=A0A6C0D3C5_9ZZZZ
MGTGKRKTQKNTLKHKIYTDADYQSNDGMLTTVWGPGMWHYLHTMSFNYPVKPTCQDKTRYSDFIYSLRYVLPCGKCRKNLCKNLKRLPLKISNMESRATFSKYVYDLHELINTMLGKKSGLSYEEVRERYEHFRARCAKTKKNATKKKLEKGCTVPLYGEKAKCILKIVPQDTKCDTLEIDDKCVKKPLYDVGNVKA